MKAPFKIISFAALSMVGCILTAGNTLAATCPVELGGAEQNLQEILNGMTTNPVGSSSVDVTTDCLADAADSYWSVGGSGGSVTTFVVEIAGQQSSNTMGIYDKSDENTYVELFDGGASAGAMVLISILADGSVIKNFADTGVNFATNLFGYYLGSASASPTYYSDTSLNPDGGDHMVAYAGKGDEIQIPPYSAGIWGPNEYVLAWEDLPVPPLNGAAVACASGCNGGQSYGDQDYNDLVVMVESVNPVPVPAAVWLFGSGLLGLVGIARRRS